MGGTEVSPGISLGAFAECKAAVKAGTLDRRAVRLFSKTSGWAPGQLRRELADGVWFLASASNDIILGEPEPGASARLWGEVLTLMGGDYAELAARAAQESDEQSGGDASL